MEFPTMYEHDTTEVMNGLLDTDLEATPRADPEEEGAMEKFMNQAAQEEQEFQGNRYAKGGFGWSREDRRVHRAPPGATWEDSQAEEGNSDDRAQFGGITDPLDDYLVEKLNPFSASHELPGERPFDASGRVPPLQHTWDPFTQRTHEDLPPLARDISVHGQRFRKYKDLFYEKACERSNETGGVQLHEPIVLASTKKPGEFDEEDAILEEGSKVAQNILQASVLSAIKKPASERNTRETKYIVDWLQSVEFLHNLNTDMRTELSMCCKLITLKSGEFVFRKDDPGEGFFILFKGAARLLDPNGPQDPNHKDYKPFKVLKNSTESFGEVALFSNKPRSLGIMAEGESTFVFIDTIDFLQVMQGRKHEETQAKTALLQSIPLFEQCSDEQLHNTAMFMFMRTFGKGQIIAKEGDDCPNIYLIESGEVELRQDVQVVRKFQMGKLEGGGGRDFSQAKSDKAVIEYEAQSIGLTKVFGELSLLSTPWGAPLPVKWTTSVVATTPVVLYMISKSEFLRFHDANDLPHPRLRQSARNMRRMAELQRDQLCWRMERLAQAVVDCHPNVDTVIPLSQIKRPKDKRQHKAEEMALLNVAVDQLSSKQRLAARRAEYEQKLSSRKGASGPSGKKNLSVAARLDEQLQAGLGAATVVDVATSGERAEHVALTNRGYRVDMCTEARRRLAAMAAHEVARAEFDRHRVQMTKHLNKAEDRRLKHKEQLLVATAKGGKGGLGGGITATEFSELEMGRRGHGGGGKLAGQARGRRSASSNGVDAESSFSYSMAVQARVQVMKT